MCVIYVRIVYQVGTNKGIRSYSWQNWILWLERDCPTLNVYVHDFYLTFLNAFVSSHKLKYIGMIVFVCSSETIGQVLMKLGVRVSL